MSIFPANDGVLNVSDSGQARSSLLSSLINHSLVGDAESVGIVHLRSDYPAIKALNGTHISLVESHK